jgi:hypothetical protein
MRRKEFLRRCRPQFRGRASVALFSVARQNLAFIDFDAPEVKRGARPAHAMPSHPVERARVIHLLVTFSRAFINSNSRFITFSLLRLDQSLNCIHNSCSGDQAGAGVPRGLNACRVST